MEPAPFITPLAAEVAADVLERFLRYVRIDTQADASSSTYPSTGKQLDLSRVLVDELREIGLADVRLTEHGYVFATLPGTAAGPVVGLLAHVDTAPETPGGGVEPIMHLCYDGGPIVLPGNSREVIDPEETVQLAARLGHDIVTSDGTTLLGADDKAGVAEIVAAVAWLVRHPELPHPSVRIAFTVDEETGRGTDHFDLDEFGAELAYTLDGSGLGSLESESFTAQQLVVTFRGRGTHPGTAKGKLVNSVKLAADLVAALPRDTLSPETTEGRQGFVHPHHITGTVEETTVTFIARDHDEQLLDEHVRLVRQLAEGIVSREPRAEMRFEVEFQYPNMGRAIEAHPRVVEAAVEAYRRIGVEPMFEPIRGGTDGSRLSAAGLPTPNLFTGGQDYHSLREWASVQDMAAATAMIVELVQIWADAPAA
jgi:tripeptide aminopeptidase